MIYHVVVTIIFTLAVDAFVLWRVLRWPWLRAAGVSVLINVASVIASVFAYEVVASRIPLEWSLLHVWVRYHLALKALFFGVAYTATLAAEYLIVRQWERERNPWQLLGVVAAMNLVTMLPGAIESAVASRPRVADTFELTRDTPWLQSDRTRLYFFDVTSRTLNARELGGQESQVISDALPVLGYRVGADQRMCVLSVTNTAVLSWIGATGRYAATVPLALTNILHVDCAPDGAWYAVAVDGQVRMYALPGNTLTASVNAANVTHITAAAQPAGVAWRGSESFGVLALDGSTNSALMPQPFWCWSPFEQPVATAVFTRGDVTIQVRNGYGIDIWTPSYTDTFVAVRGGSYRGLDFTPDGRSFVFVLGSEILALDIETRRVGHVCLGAAPVLTTDRGRRE